MIPENIVIESAQFDDQEKVATFLINTFADSMNKTNDLAVENGMPSLDVEDELRAADDFYFSSVELMDCCQLAKQDGNIIGLSCINPFTSSLQYIAVNPEFQRLGIGSRLLALSKKVLSKKGGTHIKLDMPGHFATPETLAFFQKNKLIEVSRSVQLSGGIF